MTPEEKAETLRAAREMLTHTKEILQSVYGEPIPFVLIYAKEGRKEMLTNMSIEDLKRLLENAMEQVDRPPEHLKP